MIIPSIGFLFWIMVKCLRVKYMFCSVICKFITEGRQEGRNLFYIFLNLSCMQALMFPLLSLSVLCLLLLFSLLFVFLFLLPA